jgi:predicted porin
MTLQTPGNSATIKGGSGVGKDAMKINDGGVNGMGSSRIGMKGVEDLGSGLKAYFVLEAQVSADTGDAGSKSTQTSSTSFFNREAYVALGSSSLGDIRLGRLETITRETNRRVNDVSGENEFTIAESLDAFDNGDGAAKQARPLFQNFGTRVDNAISYRSPVFGGLQGFATVGLGENYKVDKEEKYGAEYRGLGAIFSAGPFNASVSYEELAGARIQGGSFNNTATVGANYDFGMAVLYLAYQNSSNVPFEAASGALSGGSSGADFAAPSADHDAINVGVKVPVGNFTFKVQYTESTIDGLPATATFNNGELRQHKYGGIVSYAFSKRTSVYALATTRGGDGDQYFQRKNEYAIGIGHNF